MDCSSEHTHVRIRDGFGRWLRGGSGNRAPRWIWESGSGVVRGFRVTGRFQQSPSVFRHPLPQIGNMLAMATDTHKLVRLGGCRQRASHLDTSCRQEALRVVVASLGGLPAPGSGGGYARLRNSFRGIARERLPIVAEGKRQNYLADDALSLFSRVGYDLCLFGV